MSQERLMNREDAFNEAVTITRLLTGNPIANYSSANEYMDKLKAKDKKAHDLLINTCVEYEILVVMTSERDANFLSESFEEESRKVVRGYEEGAQRKAARTGKPVLKNWHFPEVSRDTISTMKMNPNYSEYSKNVLDQLRVYEALYNKQLEHDQKNRKA